MKTYQTKAGDTWDSIAYEIYGKESLASELMKANQGHLRTVIFSGNVILNVPELEEVTRSDHLPPWRVSL